MSEEEETREEQPAEDTGEGDKPEATEIIKQQDERIKELEKERDERIMAEAKKSLGGGSSAGQETKPKRTEEEKESRDKQIKYGKSTGAQWANDMEKEDAER